MTLKRDLSQKDISSKYIISSLKKVRWGLMYKLEKKFILHFTASITKGI